MPTCFRPAGRTLAGGDIMPVFIPCDQAAQEIVNTAATSASVHFKVRELWVMLTAFFL